MISVIIPIYNGEKHVLSCINKIKACKEQNLEFILINDGSNDNTEIIIKNSIKDDPRINYFYKKNSGVSDTRNFGLQKARGKYVAFLDVDDSFKENLYSEMLSAISNSNMDLFIFGMEMNYTNNNVALEIGLEARKIYTNSELPMKKIIEVEENGHVHNKLYKISIIRENDIKFDSDISIGEDYLFNLNYLIYANTIFYLETTSYIYNIYDNSTMRKYNKDKFYIYKKLDKKIRLILNEHYPQLLFNQDKRFLIWIYSSIQDEVFLNDNYFIKKSNIIKILDDENSINILSNRKLDRKKIGLKYFIKKKILLSHNYSLITKTIILFNFKNKII